MTLSDRSIAALFVDADGVYSGLLPSAAVWDEARDARLYLGPHTVVAHPPCERWTNFAKLNYKRWSGAHNKPGNDSGCFASALKSVRIYGGVLEHPAGSHAWPAFGLQAPSQIGWQHIGDGPAWRSHWVCEIWQSAYGHRARKKTWLYYVGKEKPFALRWQRKPGTHQCGWFDRNKPTLTQKEAAATPLALAKHLVRLASRAR